MAGRLFAFGAAALDGRVDSPLSHAMYGNAAILVVVKGEEGHSHRKANDASRTESHAVAS